MCMFFLISIIAYFIIWVYMCVLKIYLSLSTWLQKENVSKIARTNKNVSRILPTFEKEWWLTRRGIWSWASEYNQTATKTTSCTKGDWFSYIWNERLSRVGLVYFTHSCYTDNITCNFSFSPGHKKLIKNYWIFSWITSVLFFQIWNR